MMSVPDDSSLEAPSAPSHEYLVGGGPFTWTPNSVLLYVESSFVSVSDKAAVPMTSPCRSWSCRTGVSPLVCVAPRLPSIHGIKRVYLPEPSSFHVGTSPSPP